MNMGGGDGYGNNMGGGGGYNNGMRGGGDRRCFSCGGIGHQARKSGVLSFVEPWNRY